MKKIIALVLTVAMVISMICCVAGAEFTDAAKISVNNSEAVTVLSELGIIAGMEDGSFAPDASLTRAQAAKIIACMTLGVDAANGLAAGKASFTDVPATHWSNKFVEYCASKGIVSGTGSGKFSPNAKLTGFAFAKMLLVAACGVNAEAEGLVGNKWETNTNKLLKEYKLNSGVSVSAKEISRQNACHLALNCMFYGEADDPEGTLAYTTFGVIRAAGGNDKENLMRPTVVYTSENEDAYWEGTDLTVGASPITTLEGVVTGGKIYEIVGNRELGVENFTVIRNGVTWSTKSYKDIVTKGNSGGFGSTCAGGVMEAYYDASNDYYTFILYALRAGKIESVVEGSVTSDGTVLEEGSVTLDNGLVVPAHDFTQADVGSYCMYNGTGKGTWTTLSTGTYAERATIITGVLSAVDGAKSCTIGGKKYSYPRFYTTTAADYISAGGQEGDTVNAVIYKGLVYAVYQ